jgi:molybdopterin converting factor small subunit
VSSSPTITITVRYFAILRDLLGKGEERLTVPPGRRGCHISHGDGQDPRYGRLRRSMMQMVNHDYVEDDRELRDGDEVAFIPPVSGGTEPKLFAMTTRTSIP